MSREPPEPTDSNFATVVGVFSSSVSGSPHREEQRGVEARSVSRDQWPLILNTGTSAAVGSLYTD